LRPSDFGKDLLPLARLPSALLPSPLPPCHHQRSEATQDDVVARREPHPLCSLSIINIGSGRDGTRERAGADLLLHHPPSFFVGRRPTTRTRTLPRPLPHPLLHLRRYRTNDSPFRLHRHQRRPLKLLLPSSSPQKQQVVLLQLLLSQTPARAHPLHRPQTRLPPTPRSHHPLRPHRLPSYRSTYRNLQQNNLALSCGPLRMDASSRDDLSRRLRWDETSVSSLATAWRRRRGREV